MRMFAQRIFCGAGGGSARLLSAGKRKNSRGRWVAGVVIKAGRIPRGICILLCPTFLN